MNRFTGAVQIVNIALTWHNNMALWSIGTLFFYNTDAHDNLNTYPIVTLGTVMVLTNSTLRVFSPVQVHCPEFTDRPRQTLIRYIPKSRQPLPIGTQPCIGLTDRI
jgi:hypothetical protein